MSQKALVSGEASPFVKASSAENKTKLPVYLTPYSTGLSFPTFTNTPSETSVSVGQALSGSTSHFYTTVQRDGYWKLAELKVNFRFGGTIAGSNYGPIGLTLLDTVVQTFSTVLRTQSGEDVMTSLNMLTMEQKLAILQRAHVLDAITELPVITPAAATDYCTYVPLLICSFENVRNFWNVEKLEPIRIRSTFRDNKQIGLLPAITVIGGSVPNPIELFSVYSIRPETDKEKIYKANFGSGMDMPILSYDSEVQVNPIVGTGALATYKFKLISNVPASAINIFVRPMIATGNKAGATLPFSKLSVRLNNSPFITDMPYKVLTSITDMAGCSNGIYVDEAGVVSVDPTRRICTINFNEKPLDKTSFSGSLAFGNIDFPEFFVSFNGTAAVEYEIVSVINHYTEMLQNGSSGKTYVSVSS